MLQMRLRVGYFLKGSIIVVLGSGIISISDALIACHPLIEEPSKPTPSSKVSSLSSSIGTEKCCQIPGKSMNLKSTITTSFSWANANTSFGIMI
ncbi:hypothetical protein BMS3Abin08_00037 [bacterium BMS3Abin08]|nr:hypothetical protein BMS3Abin08_00037 [bacterium BMS3Abin08]